MGKRRLDALLAERGLFSSRTRAAASVMAGEVHLGEGRRRASKPSELVDVDERLSVEERARFVSRGGIKLANALDSCGLQVAGRSALDVGASTGGFSDCLLQRGVRELIAVDVGYGELAWNLRRDPRVSVLERTNARALTPATLPFSPDLAVIDVSFISLAKVLGPVLACLVDGYDVLALVKPQFEVGRRAVGKGGVVRDSAARRATLVSVGESAIRLGAVVVGYHSSGLAGPKGNRETFIWLRDPRQPAERTGGESAILLGRGGEGEATRGLESLAREVEP